MQKRTVKIGEYNTADYGWTLTGCAITAPELKTNYVDRPGGDGTIDLSTVLTDGIPRYNDRTLTITLENSQGNREHRENIINDMVNQLDGLVWRIVLPDRPDYYITGRVHVQVDYSDLAHAMVTITAQCEPWFYKERETVVRFSVDTGIKDPPAFVHNFTLLNDGRKVVTPTLQVEGTLRLQDAAGIDVWLNTGVHVLPSLQIFHGLTHLACSGVGTLTITYREAVLR